MRIDGGAHQRSEREVGPLRPKSQKIAAQRQILARQLSGMSGIFLRTGRDLQRLHWLADDAVHCEPVSAPKFPANREINREFWRGDRFAVDCVVRDRKSTRLNSSHRQISYAVFCLQ